MNKLLVVQNLTKTFKGELEPSLNDVSFELNKGGKLALIGPDGSGKTTLLRLITGLIMPDGACKKTGAKPEPVYIDGLSPYENQNKVKKIIGYMPQKFGLYEDLTVIENLNFYAGLKNINKKEKAPIFDELLEFAGLSDFKNRLAGALSGGMKQKLGLSCVLLSKPKILFLDEPTVGVDPVSRRELLKITDKLSNENNIGIIWATSYLDEAQYFEKVLVLANGKKIYYGTAENAKKAMEGLTFYTFDKNKDNRNFLSQLNKTAKGLADATIEGNKIRIVFETKEKALQFPYPKEKTEPIFEDFIMSALNDKSNIVEDFGQDILQNTENDIAIEARGLTKVYKNFKAADNITFEVKKGEIFGLLGPNGAGKSTTFKMLCSLVKPTEGVSKIFGYDITKEPIKAKKNFGYMAQKFSLFGNLSVKQNVEFFMGVYGVKSPLNEVLRGYGLEKYLNQNASNLPLGYKQRLSLLCAFCHNPPVLFLDEPTSGVDPVSRREFWMRINNLAKHKTSVLVTTHFMDEAQFCDRVALVYKGKILVIDTPSGLKNSVKSEKLQNPTMEDAFVEIIRRYS